LHHRACRSRDSDIADVASEFAPMKGAQGTPVFEPEQTGDPGSDYDGPKRVRDWIRHSLWQKLIASITRSNALRMTRPKKHRDVRGGFSPTPDVLWSTSGERCGP
jgi:hypothetical protein